jgi:hypothetical protein
VPDLISLEDVTAAADRIADHVLRTPHRAQAPASLPTSGYR